jgi:curved DNA-binding protein
MKFKDYYRTMGVDPAATADEIKHAYRKLAKKYHPDVSKDPKSVTLFTELGEANEVLKDPARRAAYDQMRAGGWREGQEVDAPPSSQEYDHSGGPDHGDLVATATFSNRYLVVSHRMVVSSAASIARRGMSVVMTSMLRLQ